MALLYSFTVALFLTTALIPLCIRLAPRLGLIDLPDPRKVHARAIPRCGGLGMAIGVAIPLLWFLPGSNLFTHLIVGCGVILVFGLLDDRNNLNYRWKFFGQIMAVLIVMHGGLNIHRLPLLGLESAPIWLTYPITFLFLLGVTNAVNLTDGLDGLAAGTTLLALAVIFILAQQIEDGEAGFIALTAVGGILAFLRYNTFPAQVFMGDTGSQLLGFIAACLSIMVTQASTSAVSAALPLLILGLPVLDTFMVMSIRIAQKRSPFSPDRNHLHHQIMALGFRHNEAVAIIYLLQIVLLGCAYTLRFAADQLLLAVYGGFCLLLLGSLQLARHHQWHFRAELPQQAFIDRRNIFLRKLDWFYRNSTYIVQLLVAALLVLPVIYGSDKLLSQYSTTTALACILLVSTVLYFRFPAWSTRINIYVAAALSVYLITANPYLQPLLPSINGTFIGLAAVLALAIRMTRREHFRLDTQDLLILVVIVIVPLLPFDALSTYAIGEFTLRLAVFMYSCEFIIGKSATKTSLLPINIIAMLSILLAAALHGNLSFF